MVLAGRRYYPIGADVPWLSFTLALLFTTICLISLGFVLASLVPTARFAQPLGTLVFYPMLGLCGLFVPIAALPAPLAGGGEAASTHLLCVIAPRHLAGRRMVRPSG